MPTCDIPVIQILPLMPCRGGLKPPQQGRGREKEGGGGGKKEKKNMARSKPRSNSLPADFIAINFFFLPPSSDDDSMSLQVKQMLPSVASCTQQSGERSETAVGSIRWVGKGLISGFCLFSSLWLSPNPTPPRCCLIMSVHAVYSKSLNATGVALFHAAGCSSTPRLNLMQSRTRHL